MFAKYPDCVEEGTVLRHAGAHAVFVDVTAFASRGCWQDRCESSDKFDARDRGVCALACGHIDECTHWAYGVQDGSAKCFLRKSDAGREAAEGWQAGSRDCVPAEVSDAVQAFYAAELPVLRL